MSEGSPSKTDLLSLFFRFEEQKKLKSSFLLIPPPTNKIMSEARSTTEKKPILSFLFFSLFAQQQPRISAANTKKLAV
jgi:hypothetical protein